MNTFKTIVVVATLLCVGYGAHVVLNKPIPNGDFANAEGIWNDLPDFSKPEVDLGTGPAVGAELPPLQSLDQNNNQVAATSGQSFVDTFPAPNGGTTQIPAPLPVNPGTALPPPNNLSAVPSPAIPNQIPSPIDPGVPSQLASPNLPTHQFAAPQTNTPSIAQTTPGGSSTNNLASANIPSAVGSDFDDVWTSAQTKLQNGNLADALLALSMYYDDVNLNDVQRGQLIPLLDQLAGTVIYSGDHTMDAPYVVQPGETLESVSQAHGVPVEFLRCINGLEDVAQLTPGQSIKVVRGPFRGELSLSRRELTLFLGRFYAGRFSVGVGLDLPAQATRLQVVEKSGPRAFHDFRTGQQIPPGDPTNPYGNVWIGLRDTSMPNVTVLGLHSAGSAVDASDTRGCISISPEDASDLVAILALNSTVSISR